LDNNLLYNAPIGHFGQYLKILFYKILISNKILNSYKNIINKLNIKVDNFIPSPLSSALAVLSDDEKKIGSICIDLGHSNTSISIFENNNFVYGDSVLVGSNNITNDIARGVSTTIDSAERLKTLYSSLISAPSDEYEIIEVPMISGENDKFVQINRLKINSIVKPRVEETLEMIWQKLKQNNLHKKQIKNVVLTGGGSQQEGISEYAELIFSSNVRIGYPKEGLNSKSIMKNSSFADVIGCGLFDPDIYLDKIIEKQGKKIKKQGFNSFFNWLDQYI
jgi:Actin-like ATPase involved in cell division